MESIKDATERLYNALKGKNKEEVCLDIVMGNNLERRLEIADLYQKTYGKELYEELKSKLSWNFKDLIIYLFLSPVNFAAKMLHKAFKGFTTDEGLIFEMLAARTQEEYRQIEEAYKAESGKELIKSIEKAFSNPLRKALITLITTPRRENTNPDKIMCSALADKLIEAGENNWISNDQLFSEVFVCCSPEELVLVGRYYYKKTGNILIDVVEKKLSGKNKTFLKEILYDVIIPHELFAEKIYLSIKGLGTDTALLNRVLASRCQIDMLEIREIYQAKYNITVREDIVGDTSGIYQKLCVCLAEM